MEGEKGRGSEGEGKRDREREEYIKRREENILCKITYIWNN